MRRNGSKALSPALISRIARLLFNGFENSEISLMVNLPENRIKDLRAGKVYPEVKVACLELKNEAIERVKASRRKITGLMWFLSRRYPRQFADPATQISLSSGPVTNNTLVISAEEAKELVNRSKTALEEIDQLIQDKNPDITSDIQ